MKEIFLVITILFISISCISDSNICKIKGSIENCPNGTELYLINTAIRGFVDTLIVQNGSLQVELDLKYPEMFFLINKRNKYPSNDSKLLWLEPSNIKLTGDFEVLSKLKVEGSISQDEFELYSDFWENGNRLIENTKAQMQLVDVTEHQLLEIKIDSLKKDQNLKIIEFIKKHPKSPISLYALQKESRSTIKYLNKKDISQILETLSPELKDRKTYSELLKYCNVPERPKIGDNAINFCQKTPLGDLVNLNNFKGKYLLIDFWSSSCGPCRASHFELKNIYKTYKSNEFEILGVSCDINKESWEKALVSDSIPWTNISDLKGANNEAFLAYGVTSIPTYILIDNKGVIIKNSIDQHFNIEQELKKIFNKNGL